MAGESDPRLHGVKIESLQFIAASRGQRLIVYRDEGQPYPWEWRYRFEPIENEINKPDAS
jgi:hypothetical protein